MGFLGGDLRACKAAFFGVVGHAGFQNPIDLMKKFAHDGDDDLFGFLAVCQEAVGKGFEQWIENPGGHGGYEQATPVSPTDRGVAVDGATVAGGIMARTRAGISGQTFAGSNVDLFVILVDHPVGVEKGNDVVHGLDDELVPLVRPVVVEGEDFLSHGLVESEEVVAVAVVMAECGIGGRNDEGVFPILGNSQTQPS